MGIFDAVRKGDTEGFESKYKVTSTYSSKDVDSRGRPIKKSPTKEVDYSNL